MSALDQPLTLRSGLVLPNRVALAPLTNTQSHDDGTLSDVERAWLVRRAVGGFGLVSTCATYVSEEGKAWKGQLGIASDDHVEGLTGLATALREAGSASIVQLYHGGSQAELSPRKLSTADVPSKGIHGATPEDLERVTADFVAAALRAQEAGFDGVELHGANGYLFTQFLAPLDNPRTDAWGGPLANRARLLRDTLRAVREAVGDGFTVGVRVSPVDAWSKRGLVLDDGVQVGRWLADDGADFVHLSLSRAWMPPQHEPDAEVVATAFREALPAEVPVLAAGGIWTREDAEQAEAAGVDVVVLGKAGIAHPDWVTDSAVPGFTPVKPPWAADHLREQAVGEALITYLGNFPGVMVDGRQARG